MEFGNINTKKNGERGWIIGHFEQLSGTPFQTNDFEIKWSKHKKGDSKTAAKANKVGKTLAVIIKGKFKIDFPESQENHVLENEGDYVFWPAGVIHSWEALEESQIITIRWPSISNDQV